MIGKIIKRARLILSDWRWWGFFVQRRFMNPAARNWVAARVVSLRPPARHGRLSEDALRASQALATSGIAMLGELLSPAACDELRRYFSQREVHDSYRTGSPGFLPSSTQRHPDAHIAHHSPQDVLCSPHLLALANDPRILAIVSSFIGCKPTIAYLAAWWSYHTAKGAQQAEFFHRDVDDWKLVKLFVYLTDVGPDSGPPVYVQHSSTSTKLTEIRRFADEEVIRAFGADNVLTMSAAAGQGFLEDTFGIHKGQPVARGTRLIFQAVYGLSPLPYSPKAPVLSRVDLGMPALDPWINRAYVT